MLKVNGVNISESYGAVLADSETETAYSNFPYAKPYLEQTKLNIPYFKKNGVPIDFCLGRPTFYRSIYSETGDVGNIDGKYEGYQDMSMRSYYRIGDFYYQYNGIGGSGYVEYRRFFLIEMIAGGGGGTGGNALFSGVGGGAGAYALILVDYEKLLKAFGFDKSDATKDLYVCARVKIHGDSSTPSRTAGLGAAERGTAYAGGEAILYIESDDGYIRNTIDYIRCNGGGGANGGTVGSGGTVEILNELPDGLTVLYSATGQNGTDGLGVQTSTCPQIVHKVGFDTEGDKYRLVRGGYSMTTDGNGAGCGGSSQFGAGGQDGRTNDGYDGEDLYQTRKFSETRIGVGGGGGHAKAFSFSNGGNGGPPHVSFIY